MHPFDIIKEFENQVASYCGSPYAVAVDSCTNAIMLCCKYLNVKRVILPARTYVGVPYAVINAGGEVRFENYSWEGWYRLWDYPIWDSARRFYRNMWHHAYGETNKKYLLFITLSFHWQKFIPIGRGGMILTNSKKAVEALRRMRYDGRQGLVPPKDDIFEGPGYHCYMTPELAARGLLFMTQVKAYYNDLPEANYPDLRINFKYKGN